jgi:hypothetical protein
MKTITQQALKSALHYDPETGLFTHICDTRYKKAGEQAGYVARNGYRCIYIQSSDKIYYAHRLAFLYMTGELPKEQVDHINRVKTDNRWDNLREVSQAENNRNLSLRKDNKSGYRGVHWAKANQKWHASICVDGKSISLGYFTDAAEAGAAAEEARKRYFGKFA